MTLKEKLVADMTAAMKARDANRLSTIRMAKAAIMNEENKRGVGTVLTDDDVLKILTTLVKQRRDSIEQFTANGRIELAEKEKAELAVLEEYLPQAASPAEVEAAVAEAVAATGASSMKDMGTVMKAALALLAGKNAEGKLVSETVKSKLSSL
ncbi:MAG: GatB/YqeY domain-containing protein [Acidobacteria bacterium]|nr:GatB/YqeY domain-containing protein [Acidobacteriota bacterium]MBK8810954.1 GatB/YqeY domain-containing protein [Acidobacteriota bacterium]